ncbi:hypothetical protein [Thermodesulfatator atlanticus]|uniref:hypothetical protein n=1 Tax=Thermodesulfatator atlanticus TaxID=501497 RepID=UPI0003B685A6|nr:hypothetical protein [Thermodesulfatator atlanticus]
MKIEVFYLPKCRSWQGIISFLEKAKTELGLDAEIITREIKDSKEAQKIAKTCSWL